MRLTGADRSAPTPSINVNHLHSQHHDGDTGKDETKDAEHRTKTRHETRHEGKEAGGKGYQGEQSTYEEGNKETNVLQVKREDTKHKDKTKGDKIRHIRPAHPDINDAEKEDNGIQAEEDDENGGGVYQGERDRRPPGRDRHQGQEAEGGGTAGACKWQRPAQMI